MITVLIETRNDEEPLARTLGSLVSAAVQGIVREVMVVDRGSTDRTVSVADHAGCSVVPAGDLAGGLRRARGEWLLLLEPGARLSEGWIEDVIEHAAGRGGPARFTRPRPIVARLLPRFVFGHRPLADGLLVDRAQAVPRLKPGEGVEALARGLRSTRLNARITPFERAGR